MWDDSMMLMKTAAAGKGRDKGNENESVGILSLFSWYKKEWELGERTRQSKRCEFCNYYLLINHCSVRIVRVV